SPTVRTKMNSKWCPNLNPHPEEPCEAWRLEGWPQTRSTHPRPSRPLPLSLPRMRGREGRGRLRVRALLVPQLEPLDLARCGLRQPVDELDPARIFPHADLLLHVLFQGLAQRPGVGAFRVVLQCDVGLGTQQPVAVLLRHDRGLEH